MATQPLRRWSPLLLFLILSRTNAFVPTLHRGIILPNTIRTNHAVSPSTTRRSANVPPLRMVSYEDLAERLPSKSVIEAVERASASSSGKVIASDVSTMAGVSLSQARKDLTTLASLTRGDISVSSDGELIYSFPSNVQSVLSANSLKYRILAFWTKIWPGLFYGIRISFGVLLLVSIFAIYTTIAVISSSSSRDDDRRRDNGGGMSFGFGYNPFWGPSPFDLFMYRPYYGYYESPVYRDPEEMGFLESVFSYIFGDGNPNARKEEQRLAAVADMIRNNNGAVTAEQLAPYLDDVPPPSEDESAFVDESFVLPIVTKLNGEPRVTEEGEIVYIFPELQMSATEDYGRVKALRQAGLDPEVPTRELKLYLQDMGISTSSALERNDLVDILKDEMDYMQRETPTDLLQEQEYKFSVATGANKVLAGGLGVVNLAGALYLGNLLSSPALVGVRLPSYFGLVQSFYPFLLGYAILFNVIPVVRNFYIQQENAKIQTRNRNRRLWATKLRASVGNLASKLRSATNMGIKMKRLGGKEDVVYDTKMTGEEMKLKKEQQFLEDFDRLLEREKSE